MEILYILIPLSILILSVAIWSFFWAVRSGQFDDLERPAHSILFDDDEELIPPESRAPDQQPPGHAPDGRSTDPQRDRKSS